MNTITLTINILDPQEMGYDPLADIPDPDPIVNEIDQCEIEIADVNLPNLYVFKNEPVNEKWLLFQDLSNMLKIKSKEALLKQLYPQSSVSSPKTLIRELKFNEFLEQAVCLQFLNNFEKINVRASKIALVKYTDRVRELLNVEKFVLMER